MMSVQTSQANSCLGTEPTGPRHSLFSNIALNVAGALIGRSLTSAYSEMERAQWFSAGELQQRAEDRLANLLRHAAENTPFYRDFYRSRGMTADSLRTLSDLAQLPIVSKAVYRERGIEAFCAENLPGYRRLPEKTSGSTGEPFQFYLDRQAMPLLIGSHLFSDNWYGLRPFDRSARVRAPRPEAQTLTVDAPRKVRWSQIATSQLRAWYEGWTQVKISAWEVGSLWVEKTYHQLEAFRPTFIVGYTSAIATIADELLRRNLRLSSPLRGVITEAEQLTPSRRRLIEACFQAPIGNRYGPREFNSYNALSCPASPGYFHINTELVVWEIVREDGAPAAPGELGKVILTDLHNYVQPFIRYDTGDIAVAGTSTCTCGRGFPLVLQIDGRSVECLRTPLGKVVSPVALGQYLFVSGEYLSSVRQYQLIVEEAQKVCLLVKPTENFDQATQQRLQNDLFQFLNGEMMVNVQIVDEIKCEQSGKRPIIKHLR
jgi:phenylacetate-CoA ligase